MFKIISFVLALLLIKFCYCQPVTIPNNNVSYTPTLIGVTVGPPYYPAYEYSCSQSIYLENDIQAKGNITSVTFYYSGHSLVNSDSFSLFMKITDVNHMDSIKAFKFSSMKKVFQGKLTNYAVPGPITIVLDTPFYYNGDSNFVVGANETKVGYDSLVTDAYLGFDHGYSNHKRGLAWGNISPWNLTAFDLTPGAYPSAGGEGPAKITLNGLIQHPCLSPRKVLFSNVTHDSAKITWSPPNSGNTPIGYDIYYSTTRFKPFSSITTPYVSTDTTYNLKNLNSLTWYYAWVRTRSTSCASVWTVVDSFKTLCTPIATPNPPEQFNFQLVSGVSFPPNCWQKAQGVLANPTPLLYSSAGVQFWKSGPYRFITGSDSAAVAFIRVDASSLLNHWLITPAYDLGTSSNRNLEFDAAFTKNGSQTQGNFDADDKFAVVISTDEGQTWSSANTLRTWASPQVIPSTGAHYIIPLSAYNGIVRIGFYVQSTSGSPVGGAIPTLFIDNVKVSQILPVTLTEFTGTKQGTANLLQWRTVTEQNNRGFELQRSINSSEFSTIGFVPTKAVNGNSTAELSYQYTDKKPFTTGSYYRLKQVDFDGKFTYSNIVFINGEPVTELVLTSLYPNPTNQLLNVVLETPKAQKVQIVIADLAGKTVLQQTLQLVKGVNNKTMNVATLAKGTYIVKVVCADGCERAVRKFVKE